MCVCVREKWVAGVQPRPDAADRRGVHHFGQSRAPFGNRHGVHQDKTILIGGLYGPCAVHTVFPGRPLLVTSPCEERIPTLQALSPRGGPIQDPVLTRYSHSTARADRPAERSRFRCPGSVCSATRPQNLTKSIYASGENLSHFRRKSGGMHGRRANDDDFRPWLSGKRH